jgi:Domain of unknown function (DUF4352)
MKKRYAVIVVLALVGLALAQATYTFTINGKLAKLDALEKSGKVYVEAQSFAKALGASVTFDAAKKSFVIVSSGSAPTDLQGTSQLAGGEGAIGKTYSLGKTDNALNFTLTSAEYSLMPVTMGTTVYAPKANEKLLVLHYTVQNPQKRDVGISYSAFKITAVDAKDVNHVFDNYIARDGTNEKYDASLKPAQKVELYAAFAVPAAGPIPKLIVERNDGSPVVRFDLRGKAKALVAPFADPADTSGASALMEVPAQTGTFYPGLNLGIKLENVAFSTDKMDAKAPGEGKRYLIATFTIKNLLGTSANPVNFRYSNFKIELRDAEGERQTFDGYLIKASRDEHAEGSLKPGEEYRFRVYFTLPSDLGAKTLTIAEGESRVYAFDVSSAK